MSTGYNTHMIAVLLALASMARILGWIAPEAYAAIEGLLLAGGLTAMRAAITAK